jgi:hypothetical protein
MKNKLDTDLVRYTPEGVFARFGKAQSDLLRVLVDAKVPAPDIGGPWLAGGAIVRALTGERQSSDLDFFFASEEQFDAFCGALEKSAPLVSMKEGRAGKKYRLRPDRRWWRPDRERPAVQAVGLKFFDSPVGVLADFDLTCCQFAYDGKWIITSDRAVEDLLKRELRINRIANPASTMHRAMRLSRRGFFFAPAAATAFALGIHGAPTAAIAAEVVSGEDDEDSTEVVF